MFQKYSTCKTLPLLSIFVLSSHRGEPDDETRDKIVFCASSCVQLLKVVLAESNVKHLNIACDILELLNLCISAVVCGCASEENDLQREREKEQLKQMCSLVDESLEAQKKWLNKVLQNRIPCYSVSSVHNELEVSQGNVCIVTNLV